MLVFAFLIIAVSCVIGACVHIRSLGESVASESYSGSSTHGGGTYLDHVASGKSPIDQRRYRFRICSASGEYKAYIEQSPSYRSRATDLHSTHRHYDGQYYVCWSKPVRSYSDMTNIAKQWADCTQKYIESGTGF